LKINAVAKNITPTMLRNNPIALIVSIHLHLSPLSKIPPNGWGIYDVVEGNLPKGGAISPAYIHLLDVNVNDRYD